MSKTITIPLSEPIMVRGREVTELTMRKRVKVRDLIFAEQNGERGGNTWTAAIAASMSGLTMDEFGEIDADDLDAIGDAVTAARGISEGNAQGEDGAKSQPSSPEQPQPASAN